MASRSSLLAKKGGRSKGDLRRSLIIRALRELMLTKGYAETSLSDLAEAAGMSVSHLLYYFDSKEAVLEELFRKINSRFLAAITAPSDDSAEQRITALLDHIFTGRGRPRQEYKLVAEMVALAVNRPKIRNIIIEFNKQLSDTIIDWFQQVKRPSGISAEEASLRTRAVLTGLLNNAQFDASLSLTRLHRVFRLALLGILGVRSLNRSGDSPGAAGSHIEEELLHTIAHSPQAD